MFEAALETLNSQHAETKAFYDNFKDYFKELDDNLKDYFKRSLSQSKDNSESQKSQFLRYAEAINDGLNRTTYEIKKTLEGGKDKPADIAKTIINSILPEKTKNLQLDEKISEQKNFGPKTTFIDFSPKSAVFLRDIVLQMSNNQGDANKRLEKYFKHSSDALDAIEGNTSNKGSLFDGLGKLLLIGGAASLLIGLFWKDKIKPWLEQTLGVKLGFFDKFNGIIESMGKFFTLGGLKLSGVGFLGKVSGIVLNSFGEFLEVTLKGIFSEGMIKIVGGPGGEKIIGKSLGNILPRIAGGLFKGLGAVAFKSIPVIGALISFGFAYKDYKDGDNVSAILNVVSGLGNLLELTPLAPLGAVISIGASVLNAILDYQAGAGGTGAQRSEKKLNIMGNWWKGIDKELRKSRFISSILDFSTGIYKLLKGLGIYGDAGNFEDIKDGVRLMSDFPILGVFPSILSSLLDATVVNDKGEIEGFDGKKFVKTFQSHVRKTVLDWIPNLFGLRGFYAKYALGMSDAEIKEIGAGISDSDRNMALGTALGAVVGNPIAGAQAGQNVTQMQQMIKEMSSKKTIFEQQLKQFEKSKKELEDWENSSPLRRQFGEILLGKGNYERNVELLKDKMQKERLKVVDLYKSINPNSDINLGITDDSENNESSTPKPDNKPKPAVPEKPKTENENVTVADFRIIDNKNKTTYTTAPTDELYGIKPDGIFDKNQKMMISVLKDVHFSIKDLNKNIIDNIGATVNNVNVNNGGGAALAGGNKSPYGYNPVTAHRESTLHILEKRRATSYA